MKNDVFHLRLRLFLELIDNNAPFRINIEITIYVHARQLSLFLSFASCNGVSSSSEV